MNKNLLQVEIIDGIKYVDARNIHKLINCKKDYSSWIARKIKDRKLKKEKDYIILTTNFTSSFYKNYHKFTIPTAIKLLQFVHIDKKTKKRYINYLEQENKKAPKQKQEVITKDIDNTNNSYNIQTMQNELFGQIRFIMINNKPYAVANDILQALGYKKGGWQTVLARSCKDVTKCNALTYKGTPYNLVSEGDIYRLVMGSTLPTAEQFERWVFDEVLPSIRQHGLYATNNTIDNMLNDPDTAIKLLKQYKEEREERLKLLKINAANKPKLIAYDKFINSEGLYSVASVAKMIRIPLSDKKLAGRNTLLSWLRNDGILISKGNQKNLPYQVYINKGYFKLKHRESNKDIEAVNDRSNKHIEVFVTSKGLEWINSMYKNMHKNSINTKHA